MQNFSIKGVMAIVLMGGAFFGFFKYSEYRLNLTENDLMQMKESQNLLSQKITDLENKINGTESNLNNALSQTEQKNSDLTNQFSRINNTVQVLKKLSATDPELLKKYSKVYFLNEHYVPVSISTIEADYRSDKSVNYQIESDVLPHLKQMVDASNVDGLGLRALSAYRSFATQAVLKSSYKVTYGAGTANKFSADQGYSEHQLGTAIDFTTVKTKGALDGFDKTPEFKWLGDNAYKYGFVISYPAGNAYYKYEPWHWRFVGITLATELHNDNMYFYDMDQRIIDTYLAEIFD